MIDRVVIIVLMCEMLQNKWSLNDAKQVISYSLLKGPPIFHFCPLAFVLLKGTASKKYSTIENQIKAF